MRATWAKNKNGDGYILRITLSKDDADVKPGSVVQTTKKDGATAPATVETVLWAGEPSAADHDYDKQLKAGDIIVLAAAKAKPKRSAREMLKEGGARRDEPATEPANEDDIPF